MTSDEISLMTMEEYEKHERARMERNAWLVAHDLSSRLDGAPVLSSYIHGLISEKSEDHFFFNKEELKAFHNASTATSKSVPGAAYFEKINVFIRNHYVHGELFMEYLKGACETSTGQLCDFCSSTHWVGPRMNRIPQPVPDYDKLPAYHYKSVFESSIENEDGSPRDPDDYMPRAQLCKDFAAGKRILANPEEIKAFAERYIVKEEYVIQYAQHLQELEWQKISEPGRGKLMQLTGRGKHLKITSGRSF